jgi:hypothetical protein
MAPLSHMQYLHQISCCWQIRRMTHFFSLLGVWIFFVSRVIAVLGDTLPYAIGPVCVTNFFLFCLIIQSFYNLLPSVFLLLFCVVLSVRRREVRRVMSLGLPNN